MERSKVTDTRRIKLEHITKEGYIGFLEGRPERTQVIGIDDIYNLTIALHTSQTLDEFLKKI